MYDEMWDAIIDLGLPPSFHILTSRSDTPGADHVRGPKLNSFMSIVRGNQDIIGTLIFGAVFERHPDLRVVCVEADAGWAPHWMYRADHGYDRHRNWLTAGELTRRPSEWFARQRVPHVPGRLGRVPRRRPDEHRAADVGERLPAQRRDVAATARSCSPSTRCISTSTRAAASCTTTSPSSTASRCERDRAASPTADMPEGYLGDAPAAVAWAEEQLVDARNYWVTTIGPARPSARASGLGRLARRHRAVQHRRASRSRTSQRDPRVTVNLESGDDVRDRRGHRGTPSPTWTCGAGSSPRTNRSTTGTMPEIRRRALRRATARRARLARRSHRPRRRSPRSARPRPAGGSTDRRAALTCGRWALRTRERQQDEAQDAVAISLADQRELDADDALARADRVGARCRRPRPVARREGDAKPRASRPRRDRSTTGRRATHRRTRRARRGRIRHVQRQPAATEIVHRRVERDALVLLGIEQQTARRDGG